MREFGENDLTTSRIIVMEADLARIRDLKDNYQDAIEVFLDNFADFIGSEAVNTWNKELSDVGEVVKAHADKIPTRAAQITTGSGSTVISNKSLEIQEATLKV